LLIAQLSYTIAPWLRTDADFLEKHGQRFLKGDYSLLAENFDEAMKRIKEQKSPFGKEPKG
jgi:hypothetical protein